MKHAANHSAWALGEMRRNGFHVRKVVWGLLLAQHEKREGEEIRAASILVEAAFKRRARRGLKVAGPRRIEERGYDQQGYCDNPGRGY